MGHFATCGELWLAAGMVLASSGQMWDTLGVFRVFYNRCGLDLLSGVPTFLFGPIAEDHTIYTSSIVGSLCLVVAGMAGYGCLHIEYRSHLAGETFSRRVANSLSEGLLDFLVFDSFSLSRCPNLEGSHTASSKAGEIQTWSPMPPATISLIALPPSDLSFSSPASNPSSAISAKPGEQSQECKAKQAKQASQAKQARQAKPDAKQARQARQEAKQAIQKSKSTKQSEPSKQSKPSQQVKQAKQAKRAKQAMQGNQAKHAKTNR